MTTSEILTSRRILRQAERAFVAEQVSTFALRVSCYYRELSTAAFLRRSFARVGAEVSLSLAAMDRAQVNLANRLPK